MVFCTDACMFHAKRPMLTGVHHKPMHPMLDKRRIHKHLRIHFDEVAATEYRVASLLNIPVMDRISHLGCRIGKTVNRATL